MLLCGELKPDEADKQQPHENEPRGGDGLLKARMPTMTAPRAPIPVQMP